MNAEDLKKRTKVLAHQIVNLCSLLPSNYLGNHIRGQLIRSATSVAANYRAVCRAQAKGVFIDKLRIVIEKADESEFGLNSAWTKS